MSFVKLDYGILDSTLWTDREARELFITALLMARPHRLEKEEIQIEVRSLKETGFIVPVGWYGFVAAAGTGIVHRARMDLETGLAALERLGAPDSESRTPNFEGRRMVRVDGGYIVLNYQQYRDKDHTAAARSKRYRANRAKKRPAMVSAEGAAAKAYDNGDMDLGDRLVTESLPEKCQ